jgi:hypothetical protein
MTWQKPSDMSALKPGLSGVKEAAPAGFPAALAVPSLGSSHPHNARSKGSSGPGGRPHVSGSNLCSVPGSSVGSPTSCEENKTALWDA